MVTPFTVNDKIDAEGIIKNLDFAFENGVDSVSPTATTGEGGLLSFEEYEKVVRIVVEHVNSGVVITPGASGSTPEAVIIRAKLAKDVGADGAYLSTPPYYKPTQKGLFAYFSKILSSVDFPFIIYNSAARTIETLFIF